MEELTSLEVCAGAGGQALGLAMSGFGHLGLLEIDKNCCDTLTANFPGVNVINSDIADFDASFFQTC
jgi:DNA (cytosine-5)-methyltransferase 1